MTFPGLLLGAALAVIIIQLTAGWISYRIAKRLVDQGFKRVEEPVVEDPFSRIVLNEKRKTGVGLLRIAMVAPFGYCQKMTLMSRIVPMAASLVERGHNVFIFVPPWDCPKDSERRYSLDDSLHLTNIRLGKLTLPKFDPFLFWRLLRQVVKFQPDIVYSFKPIRYSGTLSILVYIVRKTPWIRGKIGVKKVVVDVDDWEGFGGWADRSSSPYPIRLIRNFLERLSVRYCDATTVVSRELEKRVRTFRKGRGGVFYAPNGLRAELWPTRPSPQTPRELAQRLEQIDESVQVLLLYTRFVEVKAEELISIFAKIIDSSPNVVLLRVGSRGSSC